MEKSGVLSGKNLDELIKNNDSTRRNGKSTHTRVLTKNHFPLIVIHRFEREQVNFRRKKHEDEFIGAGVKG